MLNLFDVNVQIIRRFTLVIMVEFKLLRYSLYTRMKHLKNNTLFGILADVINIIYSLLNLNSENRIPTQFVKSVIVYFQSRVMG